MPKQSSTLLVVVLVVIVAFFVVSSKQPSLLGFAAKTNTQEASYQKQVQDDYTPVASYDSIPLEKFDRTGYKDNPAGSGFSPPQPAPASRDQYLNEVASQRSQLISALGNRRKPDCQRVPSIFKEYLTGC